MRNYQKLIAFLLALEAGGEVTSTGCLGLPDSQEPVGEYMFHSQGWVVTAFFDGGELDYLDQVISPEGEVYTCEELLRLGDAGEIPDRSERLDAVLKAAIKVYVGDAWKPAQPFKPYEKQPPVVVIHPAMPHRPGTPPPMALQRGPLLCDIHRDQVELCDQFCHHSIGYLLEPWPPKAGPEPGGQS